jgi:2-polyprenyl-3-methyl-5-hydroxy-6-metoxy-1,4-benzoquinol methylase
MLPATGGLMDEATVAYYDDHAAEVSRRFETANMSRIHGYLLSHMPGKGARVMEIGCGSGRDAAFLLANGYDIRAIDASRGLIEEALKIHPELHDRLAVAGVPFPEESPILRETFPAIVSMAVLMHIPEKDIDETVAQIRRMLAAGGTAFISVSTGRAEVDKDGRGNGGRLFLERPPEDLQRVFEKHGFLLAARYATSDVYSRGITWHSMVFLTAR